MFLTAKLVDEFCPDILCPFTFIYWIDGSFPLLLIDVKVCLSTLSLLELFDSLMVISEFLSGFRSVDAVVSTVVFKLLLTEASSVGSICSLRWISSRSDVYCLFRISSTVLFGEGRTLKKEYPRSLLGDSCSVTSSFLWASAISGTFTWTNTGHLSMLVFNRLGLRTSISFADSLSRIEAAFYCQGNFLSYSPFTLVL